MKLADIRVGAKIISGFGIIVLLFLATGILVKVFQDDMMASASVVDASMEMKIAVRSDMLALMDMLEAGDEKELADVWGEHESLIADFDLFAGGILDGVDADGVEVHPSGNPLVRQQVVQAQGMHDDTFQPRMKKVHDLKLASYTAVESRETSMVAMEESYFSVLDACEAFEIAVIKFMDQRLNSGADAFDVLSKELSWADMAMEIKSTISLSRIALEEFVQAESAAEFTELLKEFEATLEEFDMFAGALLRGGSVNGEVVVKVDNPALLAMAEKLDAVHDGVFQPAARSMMDSHREFMRIDGDLGILDGEADEIGQEMMALITLIEEEAHEHMEVLVIEADLALLLGVGISAFLALLLGLGLSRMITGPLTVAVEMSKVMADGDLSKDVEAPGRDETGQMLGAMGAMIVKLRDVVFGVNDAIENVAAGSEELSATA
ncbi:methyl-accepting chemotaxis protein [Pseudodesulfovibrio sp.]|nr:methyl-accepting chemotaxis protein [Pseudodesulfovibrio sp.]